MKRILVALAVMLSLSTIASNTNEKVTICHREGNGSSHEITVSIHAVPAHLNHGDKIGTCSGNE